jgi:hypothetical protein
MGQASILSDWCTSTLIAKQLLLRVVFSPEGEARLALGRPGGGRLGVQPAFNIAV